MTHRDELERCDAEIAAIQRQLRNGHPDLEGLCRALADWSAERRILNGLPGTDSETDGD